MKTFKKSRAVDDLLTREVALNDISNLIIITISYLIKGKIQSYSPVLLWTINNHYYVIYRFKRTIYCISISNIVRKPVVFRISWISCYNLHDLYVNYLLILRSMTTIKQNIAIMENNHISLLNNRKWHDTGSVEAFVIITNMESLKRRSYCII